LILFLQIREFAQLLELANFMTGLNNMITVLEFWKFVLFTARLFHLLKRDRNRLKIYLKKN
jgi:hypothetical protein